MIDDQLAAEWEIDARLALARSYRDLSSTSAHLAVMVLILLSDRQERERYIERSEPQ